MNAETDNKPPSDRNRGMWTVTGAVVLLGGLAVFSYAVPDKDQAASGAPLYDNAVKEALRGLRNVGAKTQAAVAGRPALPAGLSAADYYWCDKCKAYHKKQTPGGPQAPQSTPAPADPRIVVPYAIGKAPGDPRPAAGAIPPLPKGFSPADYYWCDTCKAYHKRGAKAAAHPPDTPNPKPGATIPPLPEGLSPADYYWCDKCKAYHKRPPGGAAPAE